MKYIDQLKDENILNCVCVFKELDGIKSLWGLNEKCIFIIDSDVYFLYDFLFIGSSVLYYFYYD